MSLFSDARNIVSLTTRHSDLALVGLLVAVIALMIMPLPTALVDTLIGANLALSFAIMMMTMYVRTPLEFSSFPTMLLFTTLFRVGLNITTTRLILLNADAGEIIQTFGEFALGGNFVVGAVVFLILTIVQFLVIAKGAERVAEVGARFTLDAMPGKQMSIDADMRAGVIDMEEAQRRRDVISQESKMFGAMDGAMKFVKGDSIAGMIVAVVNIVGGTVIGITQHGISAGEALEIYGILTIGDGLVSQIPSLIIAISAGILITRSGDTQEDVGAQIGGQFFAQPKALLMAGGLIFLFALIPGFPKPQLFRIPQGDIGDMWRLLGSVCGDLVLVSAGVFCVIAAADWCFQKWQFNKQHMMSKEEVKREFKESEGDPLIKGKRKQLHQEMIAQNQIANVRKAKVLVTNPTHFAVALDYEKDRTPLPVILAKGQGVLAQRMIETAREEGIPIMRNVPLARSLYEQGTENAYIPQDLIGPVAEVLRWVQSLRQG